ncbi:hypothetical protein BH10PSE6_BH10PSE6_24870 [soil metagenome]
MRPVVLSAAKDLAPAPKNASGRCARSFAALGMTGNAAPQFHVVLSGAKDLTPAPWIGVWASVRSFAALRMTRNV